MSEATISRIVTRLHRLAAIVRYGDVTKAELLSLDAATNELLEKYASPPIKTEETGE